MEQRYDYTKMFALTDELLEIMMEARLDTEAISLFIEKVKESESYFAGQAADAFRKSAKEAIMSFKNDDISSTIKLVRVAQMPRNCAESMQVTDKVIYNQIKKVQARSKNK